MQTLAVFDFDDTLMDGQSLDLFYRYVLSQESSYFRKGLSYLCVAISRIFRNRPRTRQQIKFLAFWGMKSSVLEALSLSFCTDVLSKRLHQSVYARFVEHLRRGEIVVVLSAGFEVYLEQFFKSHPEVRVIASSFLVSKGRYRSISEFCYGERKMDLLRHCFLNGDIDWLHSTAYSDHESDLPLFDSVGHPIVVYRGKKPSWGKPGWDFLEL